MDNICKISKLKIIQKKEWFYRDVDSNFTYEVSIIGDNILKVKVNGYAKTNFFEESLVWLKNIIDNEFPSNKKIILLHDYINLENTSLEVRTKYIKWVLKYVKHYELVVFFGQNNITNMIIKLGRTFNVNLKKTYIFEDYEESINFITDFKNKKLNLNSSKPEIKQKKFNNNIKDHSELSKAELIKLLESKEKELENFTKDQEYRISVLFSLLGNVDFDEDIDENSYDLEFDDPFFEIYRAAKLLQSDVKDMLETKQKLVKMALESDKLKSAFLANMSHEIRTPMNGILGFISLLGNEDDISDDGKEYIDIIKTSGDHLLNLINDIVDISKIQANQLTIILEEVNLNKVLQNIHSFFKSTIDSEKQIDLILDINIPNKQTNLLIDEVRLTQVLNNLINNAIKFTDKGYVKFGVSIVEQNLSFFVEDTGIGLDEEQQEVIFNRFEQADNSTTRDFGGIGLGLAITKGLIELMGGEIAIQSKIGKGSKFIFSLPISNEYNLTKSPLDWSGKNLLIVESSSLGFNKIKDYLFNTGAIIHHVIDEKEVLVYIKKTKIDLIILNLNKTVLPLLILKDKINNIPILAMSANDINYNAIINSGAKAYIAKPVSYDLLIEKISEILPK